MNEILYSTNILKKNTFEYNFDRFIPLLVLFQDKIISPIEVAFQKSNDDIIYPEVILISKGNNRKDSQKKDANHPIPIQF